MLYLTDEERRRFSAYLKQEAKSDETAIGLHEKLNEQMRMAAPLKEAIAKKFKVEMEAKLIVAQILDRIETL